MFICNGMKSNRQSSINTDSNKNSSTNDKINSESDLIIIDYPYEKKNVDNQKNNNFEKVENKKMEKIEIDKINLTLSNPSISDSDEIIDENEVFFVEKEKNVYKNKKNNVNNFQTVKSISFNINKKQKIKTRNIKNEIVPFKSNEFQINSINYNNEIENKIDFTKTNDNFIVKNINFTIENSKKIYQKKKILKIETNNSINFEKINRNILINNDLNNCKTFQTFDQTFLNNNNNIFNNQNDSSFYNQTKKNFLTTNSNNNFNNVKTESSKNEYCPKCEEIYKYLIYNNLPLKIITCLYCKKTLNEKVFEFFKNLYLNNILFTENCEIQYSITNEFNNNNLNEKKNIFNEKNNYKNSLKKYKKDEIINFSSSFNNSYHSNVSLAEVFRKKKSNLFLNFEQRKNNKSKIIYNSSTNIEMNNIYKRFYKSEKIKLNKKKYNSSKNLIKEPSKTLLKRLINGEKIKLTKKEIKEVNERLYKKLNEVKKIEKEKEKKEEMKKLNIFKKAYTTNLKNKVIQKYKENFNKNNILINLNNNNENNILNNESNNIDSIKLINISNHKK